MLKKIIIGLFSLVSILIIISLIYLSVGHYDASERAINEFNKSFTVQDNYAQSNTSFETGLIFYPGAKVDYRSYAYLSELSDVQVFIADFPFEISFLNQNIASDIIEDNPSIDNWYIAGHSLGGVSAINYAQNNPDKITGVITLAAYPTSKLESADSSYLAIFASDDGLVDDVDEKVALFNDYAQIVIIEGANHGQFGDYGIQKKDNSASISSDEQHQEVIDSIDSFINNN